LRKRTGNERLKRSVCLPISFDRLKSADFIDDGLIRSVDQMKNCKTGSICFVGQMALDIVHKFQIVPRHIAKHVSVLVLNVAGLPIPMNLPLLQDSLWL
jgi:hypothetical protein